MYNDYIAKLITLRKDLDNRIDREIDDCMNGIEDFQRLKAGLEYVIWYHTSLIEKQRNV